MITDLEKKEIFEKTLFFYTSIQFNELNLKGALGNNFETVEDFKKMLFSENTRTFFRNAITIKNSEEFIKHIDNEFELFNIYNVTSNELKIKWLQITYNYIVNKNDLSGFINKPTVVAFVKWYKITLNDLQPQQTDAVKPDEVLIQNEFINIFKNDFGFTLFTKMFNLYKDQNTRLANFSFLFFAMEKDFLVCSQVNFVKFLENENYNIYIEKIDNRHLEWKKSTKANLYNSIKESLQIKHDKSTN